MPEIEAVKAQSQAVQQSQIDAAYCAGFVDAEGTFMLKANEDALGLPVVCLYNNNKAILQDAEKILGGALHEVKRKQRSEKHATSYTLTFSSKDSVARVIEIVQPYLVLLKKQSEVVMASLRSAPGGRQAFVDQIHELNKKAQPFELKTGLVRVDLSQVSETDWAYLAGFLTGDGSFYLQPQHYGPTTYYYPWVTMFSARPAPLVYVQSKIGGNLKLRTRNEKWAPEGSLSWKDQKEVAELLDHLLPFMRARKNEVEILLNACAYPAAERSYFREQMDALGRR